MQIYDYQKNKIWNLRFVEFLPGCGYYWTTF